MYRFSKLNLFLFFCLSVLILLVGNIAGVHANEPNQSFLDVLGNKAYTVGDEIKVHFYATESNNFGTGPVAGAQLNITYSSTYLRNVTITNNGVTNAFGVVTLTAIAKAETPVNKPTEIKAVWADRGLSVSVYLTISRNVPVQEPNQGVLDVLGDKAYTVGDEIKVHFYATEIDADTGLAIFAVGAQLNITYSNTYLRNVTITNNGVTDAFGVVTLTAIAKVETAVNKPTEIKAVWEDRGLSAAVYLTISRNVLDQEPNQSVLDVLGDKKAAYTVGDEIEVVFYATEIDADTGWEIFAVGAQLNITYSNTYLRNVTITNNGVTNAFGAVTLTAIAKVETPVNKPMEIKAVWADGGLSAAVYLTISRNVLDQEPNQSVLEGLDDKKAYTVGDEVKVVFYATELDADTGSEIFAVGAQLNITYSNTYLRNVTITNNGVTDAEGVVTLTAIAKTETPVNKPTEIKAVWADRGLSAGVYLTIFPETPPNITVSLSPASVTSPNIGEQLTFSLTISEGENVADYQTTVHFDTTAIRYVSSEIGDYLPKADFSILKFADENSMQLAATSPAGESNGNGTLATITFEIVEVKESTIRLTDVVLTDSKDNTTVAKTDNAEITLPLITDAKVRIAAPKVQTTTIGDHLTFTLNISDGENVAGYEAAVLYDREALRYIESGNGDYLLADANFEKPLMAENIVTLSATSTAGESQGGGTLATLTFEVVDIKTVSFELSNVSLYNAAGIRLLPQVENTTIELIESTLPVDPNRKQYTKWGIVKTTKVLQNYPNPFNPETWIPYQLAESTDVSVTIHALNGSLIRTLSLGHQSAGLYCSKSRAAYWDGKNEFGEQVASGLYFYTLTAGKFSATGKMLILK